jgi:hypothetical protein
MMDVNSLCIAGFIAAAFLRVRMAAAIVEQAFLPATAGRPCPAVVLDLATLGHELSRQPWPAVGVATMVNCGV